MGTPKILRAKPPTMACPICKHRMENQPPVESDGDSITAYICDTPICPVSSMQIRWGTMMTGYTETTGGTTNG